jgi:RNA polymerase sigma factor (sigma-70 family)
MLTDKQIKHICKTITIFGYDEDDKYQECQIKILLMEQKGECMEEDYLFSSLKNNLIDLAKKINKTTLLNSGLDDVESLVESIKSVDRKIPREQDKVVEIVSDLLDDDMLDSFGLTVLEKKIIRLRSQKYTYKEISEKVEKTPKAVGRILEKVKHRLKGQE